MTYFPEPRAWGDHYEHWILADATKLRSHCPKVQSFKWDGEHLRPWDVGKSKCHVRFYDSAATGIRDTRHATKSLPSTNVRRA
jgi:hypothetical protein